MKIPKRLKIGGHIITIDVSEELENKSGESVFAENKIRLCNTLHQSQKESTLIHEIFHFLNSTMGDTTIGHALIDSLSEQFYQVLSDNKLLK